MMEGEMAVLWKVVFALTDLILLIAIAWLAWVFKKCSSNEREHMDFKLHVSENYAKKEHIDSSIERIEKKLDGLFKELHRNRFGSGDS
jgi:hypothetical protein